MKPSVMLDLLLSNAAKDHPSYFKLRAVVLWRHGWLAWSEGRSAEVSMSLGSPGAQRVMKDAVDAAVNSGVVPTLAAQARPHVAGDAALIVKGNPAMKPSAARDMLLSNAAKGYFTDGPAMQPSAARDTSLSNAAKGYLTQGPHAAGDAARC